MEMEFVHTTCIYCGTGSIFYLVYLAGDEVFNLLNHCIKGMPFSSIHAYKVAIGSDMWSSRYGLSAITPLI